MTAIAACRTCGTEPLENARFCHGCGSPVDEADTRAEYKQVLLSNTRTPRWKRTIATSACAGMRRQ